MLYGRCKMAFGALPALVLVASLLHVCYAKPFQCIFKVNGGVITCAATADWVVQHHCVA